MGHYNSMMPVKAGCIKLHQNEKQLEDHSSLKMESLYYLPHTVAYTYEQNSKNKPINILY